MLTPAMLATLAGGPLNDGAHAVRLQAADAAGNRSTTVNVAFTLDRAAPATLVFDLALGSDTGAQGDQQTTASVVTLSGNTEAGAAIALVGTNLSTVAGVNGAFSLANVALALGANNLTLRATDAAGNSKDVTRTFVRTVPDTQAPSLSAQLANDTGASSSDGVTKDASVSGSVSDNVAVASLKAGLDLTAPANFTDITAKIGANGSFTLSSADMNSLAGGALADGVNRGGDVGEVGQCGQIEARLQAGDGHVVAH